MSNHSTTQASITKAAAPSCCPALDGLLDHRFFKALCDPNRIALLIRLAECDKPCTVSEMAECCPVDISVVSRHLAILREAGILAARKQGKEVLYSVRYTELASTLRELADAVEGCCGGREGDPAATLYENQQGGALS